MRVTLWPQSLFGRLIAASVLAVLVAELFAFGLIARERELFVLQGNVREWSRRIAEITFMLQPLNASEREAAVNRLIEQPRRFARSLNGGMRRRRTGGLGLGPGEIETDRPSLDEVIGVGPRGGLRQFTPSSQLIVVPLPLSPDFEPTLKLQLQATL